MKPEQREFLNLRHFPGMLSRQQAAWRLGVEEHEIDILASAGRVTALGKPKKNGKRVFANVEIERIIQDQDSMHRNQRTIIEFWEKKNASRLLQKNSTVPGRNQREQVGNQKRNGNVTGSANVLGRYHANGHLKNLTSANE